MEFVNKSTVKLIKHNASDEDVAHAAWVSNFGTGAVQKDTSDVSKLINFLYKNKHMSPFEHGSFTFFIDTEIFVAREFMRHRTASYNETSGRYKELEGRFYVPPRERPLIQAGKIGNYTFVAGTDEQYEYLVEELCEAYKEDWERYQRLLAAGFAKEIARISLPVGIFTQFYVTMNPRNLMQFLTLRNDSPALYEIRKVAEDMEAIFAEAMPLTYAAYAAEREKERNPLQVVDIPARPEKYNLGLNTSHTGPVNSTNNYSLTITSTGTSATYTANELRKTLGLPQIPDTRLADRLIERINGRKS